MEGRKASNWKEHSNGQISQTGDSYCVVRGEKEMRPLIAPLKKGHTPKVSKMGFAHLTGVPKT